MTRLRTLVLCLSLITVGTFLTLYSMACPLCEALSGTISDDIKSAQVCLIATCKSSKPTGNDGLFVLEFEPAFIALNGTPPSLSTTHVHSLNSIAPGTKVLLFGFSGECAIEKPENGAAVVITPSPDKQETVWGPPQELTEAAVEYLKQLPDSEVPEVNRLLFYYKFIHSTDKLVSDDAYNECARASLAAIRDPQFHNSVDIDQIVRKLRDADTPPKYKSFYWMLLAECGTPDHAKLFDELVLPLLTKKVNEPASPEPAWLSASLAANVRLTGEKGLQQIESLVLSNLDAKSSTKYSAVAAIRALGNEMDAMPKHRLSQALALVLEDTESADFVIADLARWEYWEAIPALNKLFERVEGNSTFVRTPIINFMRTCPLPSAKEHVQAMAKRDPSAYRRALTLIPVPQTSAGR